MSKAKIIITKIYLVELKEFDSFILKGTKDSLKGTKDSIPVEITYKVKNPFLKVFLKILYNIQDINKFKNLILFLNKQNNEILKEFISYIAKEYIINLHLLATSNSNFIKLLFLRLIKDINTDKDFISNLIENFKLSLSKKEEKVKQQKEKSCKNIVELVYVKCTNCNNIMYLGEKEDIKYPINYHNCSFCDSENINIEIHKVEEKEIKLISFEEALDINYVNPGTVLYSYDKRNWIFADSNPALWSDFTKEHPLYFTTLSFV
jgi:hypothetical protein